MKLVALLAFAGLFMTALAAWGPEVGITNNRLENVTHLSNARKIVYGQDGVGHLVWYDNGGGVGASAVFYKRYYPTTGWTSELKLNNNGAYPAIALDADGKTIHVVWSGYKKIGSMNFHILYQKCVPGKSGTGGWVGNPTDLCDNIAGHSHAYPAVACGPNGRVAATWMESWIVGENTVRTFEFREYTAGKWQPQEEIEEPIPSFRWTPSIAFDAGGSAFVAYYGSTSLEPRDAFHVYVNERIDGTWQEWQNVTSSLGYPDSFISPCIDVDPVTGNPHVVCHSYSITVSGTDTSRYYHIYHTYRSGGAWAVPEMISEEGDPKDASPSICFAASGTAHAIWKQAVPDPGIEYSYRDPVSGIWAAPTQVTGHSALAFYSPSLTMGPGGVLHGVWTRYDASAKYPYQVWGSSSSGVFGGGMGQPAALSPAEIELSPNPAKGGRVTVQYALPRAEPLQVTVCDVAGRAVRTQQVSDNSRTGALSIDLGGLNAGVYLVRITGSDLTISRKLVVQR